MEILDWCFVVINYVFLFFLPGAAGNFFSRALSLSNDKWYGYVPQGSTPNQVSLSIEDKLKSYSYKDHNKDSHWIEFESKLIPHIEIIEHHTLPQGSYSIWNYHPGYFRLERAANHGVVGTDDRQYVFYIDPGQDFEWCVLNALYKQSYIDVRWLEDGKKMLEDPNIHKLSLTNIITSKETCIQEIQKVNDITGSTLLPENCSKIKELWDQWYITTLKKENFSAFKSRIGFSM